MWKPVTWIAGTDTAIAGVLAAAMWAGVTRWEVAAKHADASLGEGLAILASYGVAIVWSASAVTQLLFVGAILGRHRVAVWIYAVLRFVVAALPLLVGLGLTLLSLSAGPVALIFVAAGAGMAAVLAVAPILLQAVARDLPTN